LFNKWLVAKEDDQIERAKTLFNAVYNDIKGAA
jgi:hypothetical protein